MRRGAAMRLSVVLPPHVGTCLASVVHELVQRLEDAAPLARPDAADGRRHRRLGEVGYVLGQLLLVLFLHRRRFVWLPRADFGCSFLNDVGMVRPARGFLLPRLQGTLAAFTSKIERVLERPGAVATATEDREIPHYILPLVVSLSSLRPVLCGGRRALHADAGWLVTALVVSIPKLAS